MLTLVHCTWLSQWTAHCHTLSLTITPYHSLSLTIAHCHSLSLTITHYHSLSLTITHYHSLSLPITPYHSLSLTITHYHSLSLTATHYHLLQLASTHTHLHTNTHLIHTPHILFYLYLDPGVLRSSLYSVDENQRVYRLQVSDASVCPVYVCPINVICATCSQSVNQSVSQSAADHLLTYRFIYPHIISFTHISFHLLTYRFIYSHIVCLVRTMTQVSADAASASGTAVGQNKQCWVRALRQILRSPTDTDTAGTVTCVK